MITFCTAADAAALTLLNPVQLPGVRRALFAVGGPQRMH